MSDYIDTNYTEIPGGVCAPAGFRAGAVHCGVIPDPKERVDLSIIFADVPCAAAGVFTTNRVKAAPVLVDMEHLAASATARAVVANSRNANACTGAEGLEHARRMASRAAAALGIAVEEVFVSSTGHIGHPLPIDRIEAGIEALVPVLAATPEGSALASRGIMTSDDYPKETAVEVPLPDGRSVRIGAIAKGAGMICPNMATMLCYVTTDATVTKAHLQEALAEAVELSFNRITVDGDTSTNDTVLMLASGLAEAPALAPGQPGWAEFKIALTQILWELARLMVEDGEGSSKTVLLEVVGALTAEDARTAARTVAKSQLVKASWCGGDPNWGRVMDALGYSGAEFNPDLVDIYYEGVQAVAGGLSAHADMKVLYEIAGRKTFHLKIDLNQGGGAYYIYAADLTAEYVKFNLRE
jgi:glutamate N-acetyltransferase/amino-acid N-acetyltransferase